MHSERVRYVLVPGWYGSEDAHWQSHWQRALPNASRVEQQDWITPLRADWIAELDAEIRRQPGPVVLIAHSLGCVTVALWAAQAERRVRDQVRGALLVAPADVERESCAEALRNFAPISREPLPFPSVLVGSDNDQACSPQPAARHAPGPRLGRGDGDPARGRAHQREVRPRRLGGRLPSPVPLAVPDRQPSSSPRLILQIVNLGVTVRRPA